MIGHLDLTLLEPHYKLMKALLGTGQGRESAAYMTLGLAAISADPWTGEPRTRMVSHAFVDICQGDRISASPLHITWNTRGYMRLLSDAVAQGLVPAIVHTHPGSSAFFSEQDTRNEAELARTANLKGTGGLASVVLGGDGSIAARVWLPNGQIAQVPAIRAVGGRILAWSTSEHVESTPYWERQSRLFGTEFNMLVRRLRVGVVGCGGTGSPVAVLLSRLGVGHLLLIDKDTIDETNLNRVHGSRRSDAVAATRKIDVLAREIALADLGVNVTTIEAWANEPAVRSALKSCDFVFGCTDDHSGRLLLNRLAYFYGIPVIDVGLRMRPMEAGGHDIFGRVSTIGPGRPCLLCAKLVSPRRAAEEVLERTDPTEFEKRKREAYVIGAGDPAPAVVTFTTEMACVAVNEMIAALTGFHGEEGMIPNRSRRFHARDDRFLGVNQVSDCPICSQTQYWGRGDVDPFLDVIG
ncbi:MAG: ThiF family adenylyltransferase [Opitutaceae bacterium]|nr:ThiF family adenylyltransferase [Opitutaceae bacterium]